MCILSYIILCHPISFYILLYYHGGVMGFVRQSCSETLLAISCLLRHSLLWNLRQSYSHLGSHPRVCFAALGDSLDEEIDAGYLYIHKYMYIYIYIYINTYIHIYQKTCFVGNAIFQKYGQMVPTPRGSILHASIAPHLPYHVNKLTFLGYRPILAKPS